MKRFVKPVIGMVILLVAVVGLGTFVPLTVEHPEYDQGCYCMGPGYIDPNWDYDKNQPKSVTVAATTSMTYKTSSFTVKTDTSTLTEDEKYWLAYMREEEKLARDLYKVLGDKWNSQILQDISVDEQRHMDILAPLLTNHKVTDPTIGKGPGVFTISKIQTLYNDLLAKGSVSKIEALNVGIMVEGVDIEDLAKALAVSATRDDLKTAYTELDRGSDIHMTAFKFELSKQSTTTQPEPIGILTTTNIIIIVVAVAAVAVVGAYFILRRKK